MAIKYKECSLKDLIDMNKGGKLVLPNFQREFVWDELKQKSMLSSFLVGLPIGGILSLLGSKGDFASRRLCENKSYESDAAEIEYLLDGQQRTSCLYSIFSDIFSEKDLFEEQFNKYFSKIRNRWFIYINYNAENDIFGFEKLKFDQERLSKYEPDDVLPFLICEKIYKSKSEVWYHPKYTAKDENETLLNGHRLENHLAEKACSERWVPLYQISTNPSGLHSKVLKKLAKQRMDDLEAAINNKEYDCVDILGHIDPDIKEKYEDEDQESIAEAWYTLSVQWSTNVTNALNDILKAVLPVIRLPKKEIGRAISIFSSVNEGGMKLDLYDLIVARAAQQSDDKSLTERILELIDDPIKVSQVLKLGLSDFEIDEWGAKAFNVLDKGALSKTVKRHFLNALSIYVHKIKGEDLNVEHIKMKKILSLKSTEINESLSTVIKGINRAYLFLHIKCGLIRLADLHYELMLLPIFNILLNDEKWNDLNSIKKIEYWYWSSLFSGRFRDLQNQHCIEDIISLDKWINLKDYSNPFLSRAQNVLEDIGYSDFTCLSGKSEKSPTNAIRAAILQYTLSKQPTDFLRPDKLNTWDIACERDLSTPQEKAQDKPPIICTIDKHHILPLAGTINHQESSTKLRDDKNHILNSPLNYSLVLRDSNKKIGSKSFDDYKSEILDSAKGGHCLPDFINRSNFQDDNSYYEKFLELRHGKIKIEIQTELSQLL